MSIKGNTPRSGGAGVKWNALGLVGRQLVLLVFILFLARLLGPESYAVVAQAQIYITLSTMILDQGLAAALIQRKSASREVIGATTTVNIVLAVALGALTIPLASLVATFFHTPQLGPVLTVLGLGLVIKSVGIVPRALLVRALDFRATATADAVAPWVGGAAGVGAALLGFDYWALVFQILITDAVASAILIRKGGFAIPNFQLNALKDSIGFSAGIFGGNFISFVSRNADNILIGRYLGQSSLSFYSLAYRVLLLPVQMVGQTVVQVLFPALSRSRSSPAAVAHATLRSLRGLASLSFPIMALIAVSSPQSVRVVLGSEWEPLVPLIMVLAFTGARQSITAINAPVFMAMGRSDVHFKFSLLAAIVQVGGIVAGLPFGIMGVAWGYTLAGILVTPLMSFLLKKFSTVGYASQMSAVAPSAHGAVWIIAIYWSLSWIIENDWALLIVGSVVSVTTYLAIVLLVHRANGRALRRDFATVTAGIRLRR